MRLRLIVLALTVMMSGLMVVMSGGLMRRGRVLVMLLRRMLGGLSHSHSPLGYLRETEFAECIAEFQGSLWPLFEHVANFLIRGRLFPLPPRCMRSQRHVALYACLEVL